MSAHKRFCAHCRKPGGQLTANWWFPPLKLGQRRPVRVDPPCCFNPVGCGCLSASAADDAEIEAADLREARRTGGTFAKHYLGPADGWDSSTMPSPAADLPPLMPGGESIAAQLDRVRQELAEALVERNQAIENGSSWKQQCDQAISMLAQIGDALSPTGERPEEALGTLVADVQDLVERIPCGYCDGVGVAPEERFGRDPDGAPMVDGPQPCPEGCEVAAWLEAERNDAADTEKERDLLRAELASATAELARLRTIPTSKEKTMPATADDGPITDPMITATTEAIWPHLPSEVQESCYEPAAITSWAAAGAAAALRVMADEIDRGPTFSLPPSIISALVRERANRLVDVPDRGAR